MKYLSLLVLFFVSFSTLVSASETVYTCESAASGFRYSMYPQAGRFLETDEKGGFVAEKRGLIAQYRFFETFPPKTEISFKDSTGNVVCTITEFGKKITMEYDDDATITCTKNVE